MIRIRVYAILVGISILFSSCGVFRKKPKSSESTLSYKERIQFDNLYFEAQKLKVVGDYTGSATRFKDALDINPRSHAVMYQLANLNMAVQNFHDAVYWAERSVLNNPGYNFWYMGQLAQAYSKIAEYKKSAETFKLMARQEPDRPSNYIESGNQFINAKEWKLALEMFNAFEKKFGIDEDCSRKKERLYFELNKPKEAIQTMQNLVDSNPREVRYRGLLAETYLRAGQIDKALDVYQSILALDPDNGFAYFGLADIYRKKGDIETSFQYLRKAFEDLDVAIELKLQVLGTFYPFVKTDESIRKKSIELSEVLVKTHPNDGDAYMAQGDILYAAGKIEEARQSLLRSVELDPSVLNVWQKLLSIDDEIDNLNYIEADSRAALGFYPNQVFLHIINAFANFSLENYTDAVSRAEDGLEISILTSDRIDLLSILADANHELGNHAASDKAYDELLEIDPKNALALNNYSYYLSLRNERLEDALTMVKKALQIAPGQASYLDTHGWVLYLLGRYDEALVPLKKAYELMPNEPEVMEHYGMALIKTGQTELGNSLIERAKQLSNS